MPRVYAPRGAPLLFLKQALRHVDKKKCLIWPYARDAGYGAMRYKGKRCHVHRLVCELVHGKPPSSKHYACHSCGAGEEGCVNPNHLYWGTPIENQADRITHSTDLRGNDAPWSKLTESKVLRIFRMLDRGKSPLSIANKFNVSRQAIYDIRSGRRWSHIKKEAA